MLLGFALSVGIRCFSFISRGVLDPMLQYRPNAPSVKAPIISLQCMAPCRSHPLGTRKCQRHRWSLSNFDKQAKRPTLALRRTDTTLSRSPAGELLSVGGRPDRMSTSETRLPMAVCAAVAEVLTGSHQTLDALFRAAGAPGPPPDLAHHSKWKTWLFQLGNDPSVDSLAIAGRLIEEFMDLPPLPANDGMTVLFGIKDDNVARYQQRRERLLTVLGNHRLEYFSGGRLLPTGQDPAALEPRRASAAPKKPESLEELLQTLVRGLPRAMHPLTHRRRGAKELTFDSEHDLQDVLHSQLRPWIADIRPEEFTPSYAGSSSRMDFLLPAHNLVLELKRVREKTHAARIGDELIIDIEHYRRHPKCNRLWCIVYDPMSVLRNPSGLISDLEGSRSTPDGAISVRVFVIGHG